MTEQESTSSASKRARRNRGATSTSRRGHKNAQAARSHGKKTTSQNASSQNTSDTKSAQNARDAALGRATTTTTTAPAKPKPAGRLENVKKKIATKKTTSKKHTGKRGKKRAGGNRFGGGRGRFAQPQTNAERILDVTMQNGEGNRTKIPPIEKDTLRVIPIGGNEEVGRNCVIFEYGIGGGKADIVIVDIGMQFAEEDMPGIDYIVPNMNYLQGREKEIRGVIFTHGHLDHIGAAPIVLKQLGYPPVIARDLTLALIKKKVEDGNPGAANLLKTISVKSTEKKITLGTFKANFFEVEHSIMDSMGVALETPVGTPIHLGDWTISHDPADGREVSYDLLKDFPAPRILMLESLGSIKKANSSEKIIQGNLQDLIKDAKGRVILATFASQVKRVKLLLEYCESIGRKVALDGYSMRTNVEIAKELGYIKVKPDTLIPINDIAKYPDEKILVLCTGAQGEHNAALNKIVTEHHRFIRLQKKDTVVFSSSVIPGNERSIQRLKDNLYRKCDNVIHSDIMDIHMGGHSNAADIQEIIKLCEPQYFLPVYANHFFLKEAVKRAVEMGFPEGKTAVLDNGHILEFTKSGAKLRKEKADSSYVFVDGLGVGDVGHLVLRDRQALSEDGMYIITSVVNAKTKNVVTTQITSRGFIFVKDNFDIVNESKKKVAQIIKDATSEDTRLDPRHVENAIRDQIGEYLFQKTERRPMVLPVIIEV